MARRPTIQDLAREAGVSTATVDRVLNGRRESARRNRRAESPKRRTGSGITPAGLIEHRLAPDIPEMHFGFVLHKEQQEFTRILARDDRSAPLPRDATFAAG